MAQKVAGFIKLQIPAGKATPAPPVGPALGQHGVNIMSFTKEFNERTKACSIEKGSGEPNKNKVSKITREQLQKIAETKMKDLNAANIETAISMIAGTARSMGVEVVD